MNPISTIYLYARMASHRAGEVFGKISILFQSHRRQKHAALLATGLIFALPVLVAAQTSAVLPRVTDRIDTSRLMTLAGNTHPFARPQFDQGAAPASLPMDRIQLVLKRSPEQEAALRTLLDDQQSTSSPNYHKWLTPDQFGQQFGPADPDIQAVTSWLSSYGFHDIQVSRGRTIIEFSGTASQVESALHTPIHRYLVNGESHWANANDPQIPAALSPVVSGVVSLHDFRKRPLYVRSGQTLTATVTPGARPLVNFQGGLHALSPADFGVIYNAGSTMTGAGTTIGVIARTNIHVQDVHDFRNLFGLPPNDPQVVLNGPDPGDLGDPEEGEAVLDATWSGAVAPNATVKLVVSESTNDSDGIFLSEFYIIDNNSADVMTESFIGCEANTPPSLAQTLELLAEQAAAQGITYLVGSGDTGPDSCDAPTTTPLAMSPASVNVLASTPFNIAVGGTQFNDGNPNTYWKTSSTGATSTESAASYIPENVWNESNTTSGLWSSGGGPSAIFPRPVWQSGVTGIPSGAFRLLPDVSLTAASHDGYILCLGSDGNCQGANPTFDIFSGTSASVQAFGGIMALVVQKMGDRQGQADYALYKLAASEAFASCNGSNAASPPISTCIFNDITMGNTSIPGEAGFSAANGPGYDEATGLGSVNITNLVNQWGTAIAYGSTTTLSLNNGSAVNITHGQPVPVSISVVAQAPATGTPTGDVSLLAGSTTGQGADFFNLVNGSTPSGSATSLLPGGTYSVVAHYGGDGTFLASDSAPVSVTVNKESSLTFVGIIDSGGNNLASFSYGSPYVLNVQVTNSGQVLCNPNAVGGPPCPTGGVTLSDNGSPLDGGLFNLNTYGEFEDQPIQLPAGAHSIKAVYSGDNSFDGSTSTTDAVTVTQAATTTGITASQTTVPAGTNVTLTATVSTQSNATASAAQEPTGNVQFYLAGVAFGAPVPVTGVFPNAGAAQSVATKPTGTSLASGPNVFTAKYLGDNNYVASAISQSTTVNVGTAGINSPTAGCTNSTIPISGPGGSGNCLITVTGVNSFAGTVSLGFSVTNEPSGAVDPPTCSFGTPASANFSAPNTITLSATNTSGNATLTCSTTAASLVMFQPSSRPSGPSWLLMSAAVSLICFFVLLAVPRERRWRLVPLVVLLVVIAVAGVSCSSGGSGGGGGGGGGNPGTTTGAYTISVTATPQGGTAPAPTLITVNVQ